MSVIWFKVWSDLWNNKIRTLLAILSIAVGVFAIGVIFDMSDQLLTGMDTSHQNDVPSHINMFLTTRIDEDTAIRLKTIEHAGGHITPPYGFTPAKYWLLSP